MTGRCSGNDSDGRPGGVALDGQEAIFHTFDGASTMKTHTALVTACVLGTALAMTYSESSNAAKVRDTGFCHLANTKVNKVIYNGECKITQESKDYGALISIRMGSAEPMKFACERDGKTCMTGPTKVRMRDRGNGEASFRWEDFRLDVEAD
jgi:hypothetical protein